MRCSRVQGILLLAAWSLPLPAGQTAEPSAEQRQAVQKGLDWLAREQYRDGHWEIRGNQYPVTMTALGGMALLMEGSTLREGKYRKNVRRAVDWLLNHTDPLTGQIGDPRLPGEAGRYMYGHGYALLFLSCVHGEEEDREECQRLQDVLTRAVQFTAKAQTTRGGWGYVPASEGNNFNEGSVTVTQVQALRAAQHAGIHVPSQVLAKARKYLAAATNSEGGVIYSLGGGGGGDGRPAITAAALVCGLSLGDETSPLFRKWLKFCQQNVLLLGRQRFGYDDYTHYYYAQAIYWLGEDRYAELFPDSQESKRLQWGRHRKDLFDVILRSQETDGSWRPELLGKVYW